MKETTTKKQATRKAEAKPQAEQKANNRAQQTFNEGAPEYEPKQKAHNVDLSAWTEKQDKDGDRANVKALFSAMLESLRGFNANLAVFHTYKGVEQMKSLIRLKGFKCSFTDLDKVFSREFLTANLDRVNGSYRYNASGTICSVYLPTSPEKAEEAEMLGWEKVPQNANDLKRGRQRYLRPMKVYTFHQFATLAKVAVDNYRRKKQEEQVAKNEA